MIFEEFQVIFLTSLSELLNIVFSANADVGGVDDILASG